jgi:hypothetical protein
MSVGKRGPAPSDLLVQSKRKSKELSVEVCPTRLEEIAANCLVDNLLLCSEQLKRLRELDRNDVATADLYRVSQSLSGLIKSTTMLQEYRSTYDQTRQLIKQEMYQEIRTALSRDERLADEIIKVCDSTLGE